MLKIFLELAKVRITIAVAFTTITGYVMFAAKLDSGVILPTFALFLLACGAATFNHWQERKTDALMPRTQDRPIPSGRISANGAFLLGTALTVVGSFGLWYTSGILGMILGQLALIWYNLIYTPLKKKSAFAVIPGSVIGALPPAVGWVAAGGSIADPTIWMISFFFFIWQVPHFWLLLLKYGAQYEAAGFPSLTSIYTEKQIKQITFLWTTATAIAGIMIVVLGAVQSLYAAIVLMSLSVMLMLVFIPLLFTTEKKFNPRSYFMQINIYALLMMIFLSIDRLF
jgi:protoheme IX farnesyltransferase